MKVGIFARDIGPKEGGGFTYQQDIVDAIAEVRAGTRHQFVTIGLRKEPPAGWGPADYISLDLDLGHRIAGRLRRAITAAREGRPGAWQWRSDELFLSRGIDLLWSVSAGVPTRELPYVTTVLDLQHRRQPMFPEVSSGPEWDYRERIYAREIRAATIVIVGNAAGQAEVERFYGVLPERIRRLPHPTPAFALDVDATETDALRRFGLEPGYVFYPAQFWAHKNHIGLLRAIAILRDQHQTSLTAVFAGADKGNRAHVEQVVRSLGLEQQVRILGFVPRSDLVTLYRSAFALAYVTYFGPENLPPLEAFALGCPVVASDVPGAREQLGDAALLAPPSDHDALAMALLKLGRDASLRADLVQRGRSRAHAQTPARFVEGMIGVLDELEPIVRTWR